MKTDFGYMTDLQRKLWRDAQRRDDQAMARMRVWVWLGLLPETDDPCDEMLPEQTQ